MRLLMAAVGGVCAPPFFILQELLFFRFSQDRSVVPYSFFPVPCFLSAAAAIAVSTAGEQKDDPDPVAASAAVVAAVVITSTSTVCCSQIAHFVSSERSFTVYHMPVG